MQVSLVQESPSKDTEAELALIKSMKSKYDALYSKKLALELFFQKLEL